jgi:hypothetical protein
MRSSTASGTGRASTPPSTMPSTGSTVTEDQAFGLLRIASQSTHRKLADIAAVVAETGALELPPLPNRRTDAGSETP